MIFNFDYELELEPQVEPLPVSQGQLVWPFHYFMIIGTEIIQKLKFYLLKLNIGIHENISDHGWVSLRDIGECLNT
jgi:hypothetical protein